VGERGGDEWIELSDASTCFTDSEGFSELSMHSRLGGRGLIVVITFVC
jgi:hypothetical protein